MTKTLREIAKMVDGRLQGDANVEISGVNNISGSTVNDITFSDENHIEEAKQCSASAILLPKDIELPDFPIPVIYVENTRAAFATLLKVFIPPIRHKIGVSDKAYIGKGVTIGEDVTILGFAYVDDYAVIGDRVTLYPHTYIGQYAVVGEDSIVYSSATIREHCKVGERCIIHSSAVIGSDGFGFTSKDGVHTKVPQVGNVIVEDDVEIGAHVGIDRATIGSTVVGEGTKIDNLVHIGHNCQIGSGNIIVAQTGISGSTNTGSNVTFGGQSGTVGHINIGSDSVFAGRSGVTSSTPDGAFYAGFPARPHQEWLKSQAYIKKLPEIMRQFKAMEKRIKELENKR